jgi:hypothetical protein
MNLPLAKLNRDELYTFIVGIFAALSWQLYLQDIQFIAKTTALIDPTFFLAWLFMTGIIFILYMILLQILRLICEREINSEDDDAELQKLNLTKYTSFFWGGPLEEEKLLSHIYGLLTVSLIVVYHPVIAFAAKNLDLSWGLSWLGYFHATYSALTIAAYLMLSKVSHYLYLVKHFLDEGYCDILDETIYRRERAIHYAKVTSDIYVAYLKTQNAAFKTPQTAVSDDAGGQQAFKSKIARSGTLRRLCKSLTERMRKLLTRNTEADSS